MKDAKICVFCEHWYFDSGRPDWSELTPGDSWSSECYKGHWELYGYNIDEDTYRECLLKAENCKDFEMREDIE